MGASHFHRKNKLRRVQVWVSLLARHKTCPFSMVLWRVMKSGSSTLISRKMHSGPNPETRLRQNQTELFTQKAYFFCCRWNIWGLILFELLELGQTVDDGCVLCIHHNIPEVDKKLYKRLSLDYTAIYLSDIRQQLWMIWMYTDASVLMKLSVIADCKLCTNESPASWPLPGRPSSRQVETKLIWEQRLYPVKS